MQFTRLRLTGFKSFVDPTDLHIEQGLTGVVGPNGCGKSNLVEALKWVMGESSAKQMRGGEMEDVIFGGTDNRPARNIAEVVLSLDNQERNAPALLNDSDELDVSRRIERGRGSAYRVNGKDVRARDVQLLFADSASGSRSTALVSQGKIGALINAKPAQRRSLLEEAAGISGLHSRRHEAELRLKGAEENLSRMEDILVTLEAQLQGLRKQARQATRYRNISDHIRRAEASLFHLRWLAALETLDQARKHLKQTESAVAEMTAMAAAAVTKQAVTADGLPQLRQAEAEAGAELQHLTITLRELEAEAQRVVRAREEGHARLAQADGDMERERILARDAEAALVRLEEERTEIEVARAGEGEARATAALDLADADRLVLELDKALHELTDRVAGEEAQRTSLARQVEDLARQKTRLENRAAELKGQRQALAAVGISEADLTAAERDAEEAEAAATTAREELETVETTRASAEVAVRQAMDAQQEAQGALNRIQAESDALRRLTESGHETSADGVPVLDGLSVEPGYETALGAALGEDLNASTDGAAAIHWAERPAVVGAALPEGSKPLSLFVTGESRLQARLDQVGVVEDGTAGDRLAATLHQGQRLVSRDGGLWRWDGLTVRPGAPVAEAIRLEQRNRLRDLEAGLDEAVKAAEQARASADEAREMAQRAMEGERRARDTQRETDRAFSKARDRRADLRQKAARAESRLAAIDETIAQVAIDLGDIETDTDSAKQELATAADPEAGRRELGILREDLGERRSAQIEARGRHDSLVREAEARQRRLDDIARERDSWSQRQAGADTRMAELAERRGATESALKTLETRPEEIAAQKEKLAAQLTVTEEKRKVAADQLAEAENKARDADRALREVEAELAKAREQQVRAEAAVAQGNETCRSLAERVVEKLDCRPDDLLDLSGMDESKPLPDLAAVEGRLQRLLRERDGMGPVNLRAEQEAEELTEQMETLEREREDLLAAIEKLRRGIAELNREGRQRLLASFKEVDRHFQDLFIRLFGGGHAHLALTEADDPLEAGLEIMASPPGKKLQNLSLLSGGEQALTALALLFGVFLTNPAPICVLDEVDAPLDDANVDRVCSMLDEMAKQGTTRFLVVTHHRMTMARMDRLFGVTMQERGVSKLVSVDLQKAEALRTAG
ncbi:AAA family ATPase [Magnetospira sp. QH-2]|uniref:AAA family ATPase n=1 Tax=Magnetospira sp. (strain QH-2) TaxID=1288970 RepID=UPI003529AC1C